MGAAPPDWNDLIGAIYDAAMDDALWTQAINRIMEHVGAHESALFSVHMGLGDYVPLLLNQSSPEDVWNLYWAYYWQRDVWAQRIQATGQVREGGIVHGDRLIERREFRRTEIHADYAKPNGVEVMMHALLFNGQTPGDHPMMALNLYRPPQAEAFSQEDEVFLRPLIPHLQRALRIRWQMAMQKEERGLREAALDRMTQAVALLDENGHVLFANRRAEGMFREGKGPVAVNRRFTAAHARGAGAIQEGLRRACLGIGGSLRLENPTTGRQWVVTFSPLRIPRLDLTQGARILALIAEPDQPSAEGLPHFAKLYGLTPAETRTLEQLLQRESTQDIANALQISIKTLRTHLSALFAKTATSGQRELVRFYLAHPLVGKHDRDAV
jgi:DNA-binding CsgD family transcriptional regulator/PAS domain-containing protein